MAAQPARTIGAKPSAANLNSKAASPLRLSWLRLNKVTREIHVNGTALLQRRFEEDKQLFEHFNIAATGQVRIVSGTQVTVACRCQLGDFPQ